jgi:hypothetical protein
MRKLRRGKREDLANEEREDSVPDLGDATRRLGRAQGVRRRRTNQF